jgi:hypothetical protein
MAVVSAAPGNDVTPPTSVPAVPGPASPWEGKLVKAKDDTKIYLIERGKKRWITSTAALENHGFR